VHFAAFSGRVEVLQYLEKIGHDIWTRTSNDNFPISFAAYNDLKAEALEWLLGREEFEPEHKDMSGNSLAHWAAYGGNLNAIIVLESHGCPLFVENNENKHTPLSTAVCNGHSEICVYLLHKGAQLADTDAYGRNALQLAVIFGHADLLRILVRESQVSSEQIADLLRHKDNYGNDALCGSVLAGVSGPDMITALIELGLCPDGEEGTDPFPLTLAIQNNRPEIARALLGHGANPNLSGSALRTPLFAAFERDDVGIAKTLIEAGASPFALTPEKVSILQWLCKRNEKAAVRLLVNSKKFQQDFPAGEEWTPLMYAAFLGDHDLIAGELGRPDPCVGYVAPDGSSAPALMVSNGLGEWVGDLIGQGMFDPWSEEQTSPGILATAIVKGARDLISLVLDRTPPKPRANTLKLPDAALRAAAQQPARRALVDRLLAMGARSNSVEADEDVGASPLFTAALMGAEEIFAALVSDARTDLEIKDNWGRSPVDYAPDTMRARFEGLYTSAVASREGQGVL